MPNYELETVRPLVVGQTEIRQSWKDNDSPEFLVDYFHEEWRELQEAIMPDESEWDRWEVASELGDVEYLYMRVEHEYGEDGVPADVLFFRGLAWQLATRMGIDIGQAVHMKVIRNDLKYPPTLFNNGMTYDEARLKSKELWAHMGGDKTFYKWYGETFGEI